MNRYLRIVSGVDTATLHLMNTNMATGRDPNFPCPLPIPEAIQRDLIVLSLNFISFDDALHTGQLVVHRKIAAKVRRIFESLLWYRFPIGSMVPIVAYGWDDGRSMRANNTSGFNYRYIAGTDQLSLHAFGLAVDINPWQNPCRSHGIWLPVGAYHDPLVPGTITGDSKVAAVFREHGFECGVDWQEPFDPQHFQFPLAVE